MGRHRGFGKVAGGLLSLLMISTLIAPVAQAQGVAQNPAAQGPASGQFKAWTKASPDGAEIKFYAKYPQPGQKIQFMVQTEGRPYQEHAWFRLSANQLTEAGSYRNLQNEIYFIRTLKLRDGKNRVQILVDGQRVWGTKTYVGRATAADAESQSQPAADLSPTLAISQCKAPNNTRGPLSHLFPLDPARLGNLTKPKLKVIYIDFDDYRSAPNFSPTAHFQDSDNKINAFYNTVSYGRFSIDFDVHPTVISLPKPVTDYRLARNNFEWTPTYEAIRLADRHIDFSDIDGFVVHVIPEVPEEYAGVSPAFVQNGSQGVQTNEKLLQNGTFIGGDGIRIGWNIIAHEIGHLIGFIDLYAYNFSGEFYDQFPHTGSYDLMSHVGGGAEEFLGWNRFLAGWIRNSEVLCFDAKPDFSFDLAAVAQSTSATKIAVWPTKDFYYVFEYKVPGEYCEKCEQGLLVYQVARADLSPMPQIRLIAGLGTPEKFRLDAPLKAGAQLRLAGRTFTVNAFNQTDRQITVTVR